MYRFLLRPRWIALTLGVIVLVMVFSQLAGWQFGRNAERSADNELIEQNLSKPAEELAEVAVPNASLEPGREWTKVRTRGHYDTAHQLLVRYRHLGGEPGFEVLTPLVTEAGPALLVDRGWVPAEGGATRLPDVPAPPSGEVAVTGRIRRSEDSSAGQFRPESGQVRFINVEQIARTLPYPVFGGYAELTDSRPAESDRIVPLPAPEPDPGPFFSYGVQWWLFAAIAVGGLIFLAYDEAHDGALRERLRIRERWLAEEPEAPLDPEKGNGPGQENGFASGNAPGPRAGPDPHSHAPADTSADENGPPAGGPGAIKREPADPPGK